MKLDICWIKFALHHNNILTYMILWLNNDLLLKRLRLLFCSKKVLWYIWYTKRTHIYIYIFFFNSRSNYFKKNDAKCVSLIYFHFIIYKCNFISNQFYVFALHLLSNVIYYKFPLHKMRVILFLFLRNFLSKRLDFFPPNNRKHHKHIIEYI